MNKFVDPKLYGLPPSTKLKQVGTNQFNIVIQRKSRIIMKDGEGILAKVNKIKNHIPNAEVSLKTSAPICSKTEAFLEGHGINLSALILRYEKKGSHAKPQRTRSRSKVMKEEGR